MSICLERSHPILPLCMSSTLQLFSYDADSRDLSNPTGMFGGCLYKDWLFSVYHGFEPKEEVAFCFIKEGERGRLYSRLAPECMSLISIYEANPQPRFIDFLYQKFPNELQPESYLVDDSGIVTKFPIRRFEKLVEPNIAGEYFFFGNTRGKVCRELNAITYHSIFRKLEYCTEVKDFMLEFELDEPIEDSICYEGTSGAPIVDENGDLVSLVVSGIPGTRLVHGIDLMRLGRIVEDLSNAGIGE